MKIKKFNDFITEKLGIVENLESIANNVISKLKERSYHRLEIKLRDKDIKVDFFVNKDYTNLGAFTINDFKNLEFTIKLKNLNKPTLIHELKHLDRVIARNLKTGIQHERFSVMNHIINFVTNNLKFLFRKEDEAEMLSLIVYYSNPDEFEAYFNGIYHDIKEAISSDMIKEEKIEIIKEELELEPIYIFYKFYFKNSFDIRKFFNSNRDLNKFLKEYNRFLNSFNKKEIDRFTISQSIIGRLQKYFGKYLKDEEADKFYQEINRLINHSIRENFKKFSRLYTLLT